ncbi:galactose oxidase [Gigaspora margarita]|uniref:Galactose oxidase n=1 Tax=Gigaspora margarita TaxID=4874 RepID=A0A8H4B081_GIGMA|nr:galactose oxidase [Gigaspora margarita]
MFNRLFLFYFSLLSQLLFFVNCLNFPGARAGQTSALVGTKLYFFGGDSNGEVWYLDLSNSSLFNTSTPMWYKDVSMPLKNFYSTSCVSPTNNSAVFIIGGRQLLPNSSAVAFNSFNSSVFRFDPNNNSLWSIPNITNFNSTFKTRNLIQAVIDKTRRIFIFGGSNFEANSSDNSSIIYYNDMNLLDITTMSWSTLNILQAPPPCYAYTSTLLPTGLIVILIRTFNTTSFVWSNRTVNGSSIETRIGHSAVLSQNSDIIVYGGSKESQLGPQTLPNLCVLNTNSWIWFIPDIPPVNTPQSLTFHSAALYKDYMVVAFGHIASTQGLFNKDVYVLDTQKYTWVGIDNTETTTQDSSTSQKNKLQSPSNPSSINGLYIGMIVVGGIGIVLVGVTSFFGYLLYKKAQHKSCN